MNAQPGRPVVVSMVSESSLRKRLRTSTLLALAVPCVVLAQVSSSPPCKPGTDTGQSAGPIGTSTTTAESGPSVRMRGGRDDSGVVRVDGFELSYSVEGTGIPCLVINDAPAMRRGLSSELRRHFRFIFMNPRMNVRYDPTCDVTRITLDTLLDDIERVRREAKVDRVLVFGHSINGLTAYEYARKYPEHVVGVVMNGTQGSVARTPGADTSNNRHAAAWGGDAAVIHRQRAHVLVRCVLRLLVAA